ncbi:hypothetical protein [Lacinutrix chionoecetis]
MYRIVILGLVVLSMVSCKEDLSGFEGQWQCNDGSATIYTIRKVNDNSYLMKWGENNYITGVVTKKGVFETANAILALDSKTNQLILPKNWPCEKAVRLVMLNEKKDVPEVTEETVITQTNASPVLKTEDNEHKEVIQETIANNNPTEPSQTKNKIPENITNILTKEPTSHNCLIRQILTNGEYKLITVDFIQLKETATTNGKFYQIVNTNPKLRTFLLTDNTTYSPDTLDLNSLKSFKTNNDEGQVFKIDTKDGNVTALVKKL